MEINIGAETSNHWWDTVEISVIKSSTHEFYGHKFQEIISNKL